MNNSLKFILVSGMAVLLSACMMSEASHSKDPIMKCEMSGFVPGSEQFGQCVQGHPDPWSRREKHPLEQNVRNINK